MALAEVASDVSATVDVVVPTLNQSAMTTACARSLARYTAPGLLRVVWVDNGSAEAERAAAAEAWRESGIETVPILLGENQGFVRATNAGLLVTTAPYVLLLNNDAEVVEGWLPKFLEVMDREPTVGVVGPRSTPVHDWQGRTPEAPGWSVLPSGSMLGFYCALLRREVVTRVGALDEGFGAGLGDDDDYAGRVEAAGWRLALRTDLTVLHRHRTTFRALWGAQGWQPAQRQNAALLGYRRARRAAERERQALLRGDEPEAALIVPRAAGDGPEREAAWAWLRRRAAALWPAWPVVEGWAAAEPWVKADALRDAVQRTGAPTLVALDADCALPAEALRDAVALVAAGTPWVVPHRTVWRLSAAASAAALELEPSAALTPEQWPMDRAPYTGLAGGGCFVMARDAYVAAGGVPRFVGWGGEDEAAALVFETLVGPMTRLPFDLVHLWHPPQRDRIRGARGDRGLVERYRQAAGDRAAMWAMVTGSATAASDQRRDVALRLAHAAIQRERSLQARELRLPVRVDERARPVRLGRRVGPP